MLDPGFGVGASDVVRTSRRLALLAVVLVVGCALVRPEEPERRVLGVYQARTAVPDALGRIVTLWVQEGGRATLQTVDVGKGSVAEGGRWSVRDDELTVVLVAADGTERRPLVWEAQGDRLVPRTWDPAIWGQAGLPLVRR
jgi:hypothetical protein